MFRVIKTTYHPSESSEWFVQKLGITGWKTVLAGGKYGSGHHKSIKSAEEYIESIQLKKRETIYKPWYISRIFKKKDQEAGDE